VLDGLLEGFGPGRREDCEECRARQQKPKDEGILHELGCTGKRSRASFSGEIRTLGD
jgi:hypothetical protein